MVIKELTDEVNCFLTNHRLQMKRFSTIELIREFKKLPKYTNNHTDLIVKTLVADELVKREVVLIGSKS